jgi:hypothetical protein
VAGFFFGIGTLALMAGRGYIDVSSHAADRLRPGAQRNRKWIDPIPFGREPSRLGTRDSVDRCAWRISSTIMSRIFFIPCSCFKR